MEQCLSNTPANDLFSSGYAYDPNGNIMRLKRLAGNYPWMDSLNYSYYTNGSEPTNRLRMISDSVELTSYYSEDIDDQDDPYNYDEIGNLGSDRNENIDSIFWTADGKVKRIERTNLPDIFFIYDALGNRVAKMTGNPPTASWADITVYSREANGKTLATYRRIYNDTVQYPDYIIGEWDIYGSETQGRLARTKGYHDDVYDSVAYSSGFWNPYDTVFYRKLALKEYEHKDHLGNVRVVYSDVKMRHSAADTFDLELRAVNNYYPFGMLQPGLTFQSGSYRYGFNGMEQDADLKGAGNSYTTLFRQYDPRTCRWWSLDPERRKFASVSPYSGMGNNPISLTDIFGNEADFSPFLADEAKIHEGTEKENLPSQKILKESRETSGLNLSYVNGKMEYDKANPYLKDEDGNIIGSEAARNLLKNIIDSDETVTVKYNTGYHIGVNPWEPTEMFYSPSRVQTLIEGTLPPLDKRTMGWAMSLYHEFWHTKTGGNLVHHNYNSKPQSNSEVARNINDPVIKMQNLIRVQLTKQYGTRFGQLQSMEEFRVGGFRVMTFDQNTFNNYNLGSRKSRTQLLEIRYKLGGD